MGRNSRSGLDRAGQRCQRLFGSENCSIGTASIFPWSLQKYLLHTALARVKWQAHPQQYEIYHLNVILEKPVREVRQALGVNAGQVYLAKHRVSRMLRKQIAQLEKGSFAGA